MKLYKLTNKNDRTKNGCQWGPGVRHQTNGRGELCGSGWTHWYTDPFLAVLLNPIHGAFNLKTAHLWEGEGTVGATDHGLKVGCTDGHTLRRIPLPTVTLEQRIKFGIFCTLEVYKDPEYYKWANNRLNGKDRTFDAADAAYAAAAAADAAYAAAAAAAADAAAAAAYAATNYRSSEKELDLITLAHKAMEN